MWEKWGWPHWKNKNKRKVTKLNDYSWKSIENVYISLFYLALLISSRQLPATHGNNLLLLSHQIQQWLKQTSLTIFHAYTKMIFQARTRMQVCIGYNAGTFIKNADSLFNAVSHKTKIHLAVMTEEYLETTFLNLQNGNVVGRCSRFAWNTAHSICKERSTRKDKN